MFILTIDGQEDEGAYSVQDEHGNQILYMFEQEDDACRYAMMLEEDGFPELRVIEVEDEMMITVCESHGYEYTVITPNDIVIPPKIEGHDFI